MKEICFTPQTPATPTPTPTTSAVASSVKRLYHSADDTLPSPPHAPPCGYAQRALLCSALSATPPSPSWILSESTGEGEGTRSLGRLEMVERERVPSLDAVNHRGRLQCGGTPDLLSPVPMRESIDAPSPCMREAVEGSEGSPVLPQETTGTACDTLLHMPPAAPITLGGEGDAPSQVLQSSPRSVTATPSYAGLQASDVAPNSATKTPCTTTRSAPNPIPGDASQSTTSSRSSAKGTASTATPKTQFERARPQQQQAELSSGESVVLEEEFRMENEELRCQLEALGEIQAELVRRCQLRDEEAVRVGQRHASERKLIALEKEEALVQLTEAYEEQLQELQDAKLAAQSKAHALAEEVVMLRSTLADTQDELKASMAQQLKCQSFLDEATAAQTRMEAECASWRKTAVNLEADCTAQVTAEITELRGKLWAAEERAAAAELALQSLCYQLTAADQNTAAVAGADLQVDPSAVRDAAVIEKLRHCRPSTVAAKGNDTTTAVPVVFDESAVLTAVRAAMEECGMSTALSSPLQSYSHAGERKDAGLSRVHSHRTLSGVDSHDSQHSSTTTVSRASCDPSAHPAPARLSNAGLLHCRLHKHSIEVAMEHVSAGYLRAAREAYACADARAVTVQKSLLREVNELRAQLEQSRQLLPSLPGCPQKDTPQCHGREGAECQTVEKAGLSRDSPVPPVAGAVNTPSVQSPKAASVTQAQQETRTEKISCEEALNEAQRQLLHERSYIRHLQKELQSLNASSCAASLLEGLTGTLQGIRASMHRLVRDAVADMQRIVLQESTHTPAAPTEDRGYTNEIREQGDSAKILCRRWRAMNDNDRDDLQNRSPARRADRSHYTTNALPCSPLLDFAFMRSIRTSILRAEAHVRQASAALRSDAPKSAATPPRLLQPHADDRNVAYCARDSHHPRGTPFAAGGLVCDSLNRADAIGREAPSPRLVGGPRFLPGGGSPTPSPYTTTTTAAAATGQQSSQQQRVYREMCDLLQRSAADDNRAAAATAASSRYLPGGSLWASGIRPPRPPPSGMNTSPASKPSPYVAAYVAECAELHHAASPCAPRDSFAQSTSPSRHAQLSFADLAGVTQELCNVGRLLEDLRETEETREARWRQSLQAWQNKISTALDDLWQRAEYSIAALQHPLLGGVRFSCDTVDREKDAWTLASRRATSFSMRADAVDNALERARPRQDAQLSFSPKAETFAVSPHMSSRLAEVLSGKRHSREDSATPFYT
ncbi:hypothetical protein JKF63_02262 [Porcisia hertigi]|uniref:Uncharacterized protein n=1 Tax=Porcisia hertigi TaxID=2761500 RepID=A0A836H7Q2_9TRYP|nr:hypothetical protein JKF63_02262 [Porcisia hertigi]